MPVTYLFVPGDNPERFAKAMASTADVVIVDLEDAVAPAAKSRARSNVAAFLAASPLRDRMLVRINSLASDESASDLRMLADAPAVGVMLAKTERAEEVQRLAADLKGDAGIVALIESARGIANVNDIATTPRVARLAFGALDYAADLCLSGDPRGLIHPLATIALASRLCGLPPPVAAPTLALDDEAAIAEDVRFAQAMGFTAKLCIHPRQVHIVQRAFAPGEQAIEWAQRVIAASRAGSGAAGVDGMMVDKPVVDRARSILAAARRGPTGSRLPTDATR